MEADEAEQQRRRRRVILQSFYGSAAQDDTKPHADEAGQPHAPPPQPPPPGGHEGAPHPTPHLTPAGRPPAPSTEERPASARARGAGLDEGGFDAEEYFEALVRGAGVRGLLKRDQTLLRDIKKLDSDMKTLVYENYSKFISATDTIRDMRAHVEHMEDQMQRLAANMDTITAVSDAIHVTLAPRRCASSSSMHIPECAIRLTSILCRACV